MRLSDCYRLLEIPPGSSPEEVKRAHRDLTKVWHPDRFGSDPALRAKAEEKLKAINEAYETIRDSAGGSTHDRWRSEEPDAGVPGWRVRSGGREMQFPDLRTIARYAERGALREDAEVLDPSAGQWAPITSFPQFVESFAKGKMRRYRGWALTFSMLATFILLRRPTPGGLLIAAIFFAISFYFLLKMRK